MDPAQAEHFRSLLLALQASLADTAQSAEEAGETVELDQARVGRLSRMDAMQAQQMALETERRNRARLVLVQRALQRSRRVVHQRRRRRVIPEHVHRG